MEAKELRIGNYVNVPREDQSPFKIDFFEFLHETDCKVAKRSFIGKTEVHPLTWYFTDLKPIPLTEYWLIKFGIKGEFLDIERLDNKILRMDFNSVEDIALWISQDEDTLNESDTVFNLGKIKYVHELQNLYFAFTKQELIISN